MLEYALRPRPLRHAGQNRTGRTVMWTALFFLNSALLGVGLAMDAFSVSVATGLQEPKMRKRRAALIAGVFGIFQFLMPLLGWTLVSFAENTFRVIRPVVPWVAFAVLVFLGVRMIIAGLKNQEEEAAKMGFGTLFAQGVATSLDALSAGLAMYGYGFSESLVSSAIIGVLTFIICIIGVWIGKHFGDKVGNRASVLGGAILIAIGIKILVEAFTGGNTL